MLLRILILAWISQSATGLACASCGSGGEDPLILYPNEEYKIYQGLSSSWNIRNIDSDGRESNAGALERRQTLALYAGIGLSSRSFIVAGLPVIRNSSDDASVSGVGDFSFSGRYGLVMQNIAEPLLPQIQLIGGFKPGRAVSIHDSSRSLDQLDVRGSGFDEIRAGIDLWHAVTRWKIGLAQVQIYSVPKRCDGVKYEPGMSSRSVVNLGYGFGNDLRIGAGVLREHKQEMSQDGSIVPGAGQLAHKFFVNADLMWNALTSLRVGYTDHLAALPAYNSYAARQINAAVMRSF